MFMGCCLCPILMFLSLADGCPTLTNMLVVVVGGVPIAMPTVLSVTLALGAARLAKEGAIVARMSAVEEMAGMDILCSDKTGESTAAAGPLQPGNWVGLQHTPNCSTRGACYSRVVPVVDVTSLGYLDQGLHIHSPALGCHTDYASRQLLVCAREGVAAEGCKQ